MGRMSVTNNEGYTFTFQCEKKGFSVSVQDRFGIKYGKADHVYLNGVRRVKLNIIKAVDMRCRERMITRLAKETFAKLANTPLKHTYDIQFYTKNGQKIVVIGPYGLKGGGIKQNAAFAGGGAQFTTGLLITKTAAAAAAAAFGPFLAFCAGAGLIASGVSSMYYAIATPEEKVNGKDYAIQAGSSFAGGAASAAVGVGVPALAPAMNGTAAKVAEVGTAMLRSTTAHVTSTVAEAALKQDSAPLKKLTMENVLASTIVGLGTGIVSGGTKNIVETVAQNLMQNALGPIDHYLADILLKTIAGGIGGAAGGALGKVFENGIKIIYYVKVMYETVPDDLSLLPHKLYLYMHQNQVYYKTIDEQNQLVKIALSDELKIATTARDANSLFNALAIKLWWITSTRKSGVELRNAAVEQMRTNWTRYQPYTTEDAQTHLNRIAQGGWPGEAELWALSDNLQMQISVKNNGNTSNYGDPSHGTCLNILQNGNYYDVHIQQIIQANLESIKAVLRSNNNMSLSKDLRGTISIIASKYGHVPVSLMHDVQDAAAVGAATGAVIAATNACLDHAEKAKRKEEEQKEAERKETERKAAEKKEAERIEAERKAAEQKEAERILAERKAAEKKEAERILAERKEAEQKEAERIENERMEAEEHERKRHADEEDRRVKKIKTEDTCVLETGAPDQITAAQKSLADANQKLNNAYTLAGYTVVDMENVGTGLFDDFPKKGIYGYQNRIDYIEAELYRRFAVPVGCCSDSLKNVLLSHDARDNVGLCVKDMLKDWQGKGSGIAQAQAEVNRAKANLDYLQQPHCAPVASTPVDTTSALQSINILELVNNAEYLADKANAPKNPFLMMRHICLVVCGSDTGECFNDAYLAAKKAYYEYERMPNGKDKPTQYGFMTQLAMAFTGQTNVPVEMTELSPLQKVLHSINKVNKYTGTPITLGIGVVTNGSNLQMGSMDYPRAVNVISPEQSHGVEGFRLPVHTSSTGSSSVDVTMRIETQASPLHDFTVTPGIPSFFQAPDLLHMDTTSSSGNSPATVINPPAVVNNPTATSSQNTAVHIPPVTPIQPAAENNSSGSNAGDNVVHGLSLLGDMQSAAIGHSSLPVASNALNMFFEVGEHGADGLLNVAVDLGIEALAIIPQTKAIGKVIGTAVELSQVYDDNVTSNPCQVQQDFADQLHAENPSGRGDFNTRQLEREVNASVTECVLADALIRLPAQIVDALKPIGDKEQDK